MTLHHRDEGTGPVVVLLHAGVADLRMWDVPAADLARDHRVVRCDLRGYGSTPLAAGTSYSDAEDVLEMLDELGIDRFVLVGASYGGYVAQQVASAVPDRVERLVLLAAPSDLLEPDDGMRSLWEEEGRLVEAGDLAGATELNVRTWVGPEADGHAREQVRLMQRAALEAQVAAGEDVDNRDLPVVPERLTMPTRVFVGAHDQPWFRTTARELASRLPAAQLEELSWAGHLPTLERPDEGIRLLREALG
jgi:pimeloyl-ACP methyl ester carboxylesterase